MIFTVQFLKITCEKHLCTQNLKLICLRVKNKKLQQYRNSSPQNWKSVFMCLILTENLYCKNRVF